MNTLRALILLAMATYLPVASASEITVTQTHSFDERFNGGSNERGFTHFFSPLFPMEFSFAGFIANLNPTPHPIDFEIEVYATGRTSLVRHVFPLPPPDANGNPVSVPFSFTDSSPFSIRYAGDRSTRIHVWGTETQTGTVVDAPIIKLPNLVVPAGTTEVQGIATITGGSQNITGLEFPLQVANGGPDNDPPANSIVPITFTNVETDFPGSVFSSTDVFQFHPNSTAYTGISEIFPGEFQLGISQTIINYGEPFASINGTDLPLVSFTLGLHDPLPGTYPLTASKTRYGRVRLLDDSADDGVVEYVHIIDGSITILPSPDAIVPEPSAIVLAGMAALCVAGLSGARSVCRTAAWLTCVFAPASSVCFVTVSALARSKRLDLH